MSYDNWMGLARKEREARAWYSILVALALGALFVWAHLRTKEYEAEYKTYYHINAPFVFSASTSFLQLKKNQMAIFTFSHHDREKAAMVKHAMPWSVTFVDYDISNPAANKTLGQMMKNTGRQADVRGPVFVINGRIILYSGDVKKQIKQIKGFISP